jgi:hypothetical protein
MGRKSRLVKNKLVEN